MASGRLTWYQGSILPFASLWHTLLRVSALNCLRLKELPDDREPDLVDWLSRRRIRAMALYNETHDGRPEAVSTSALARCIGEPHHRFRWSHLGRLPKATRFLVRDVMRICPACAVGGYHSVMFSIALLERCPVHGCELLDRCRCGKPFDGRIDRGVLELPGHCTCGKLAFFSQETCRRPTLAPEATAPLRPIARWLDRLSTVSRPWTSDREVQRAHDAAFLRWLPRWCQELELGYPDCFVSLTSRAPGHVTTASKQLSGSAPSKPRRRVKAPIPETDDEKEKHLLWQDEPATTAYRAMARHIRRHVARGAEPYAISFLAKPEPLQMAATMRSDRAAMVAFADLLFTGSMQPQAELYRWPYREIDPVPCYSYVLHAIEPALAESGREKQQGLTDGGRVWLHYHAGEALMMQAWHRGQRAALWAVHSGIADWRSDALACPTTWATAIVSGRLRFVSMSDLSGVDWTLRRSDKSARCRAAGDSHRARQADVMAACRGPCLTWSEREGWRVLESARPSSDLPKRHRLLGVADRRPTFWIFRWNAGFAVRSCEHRVQALGETTQEAIDALRTAMRQHQRQYPDPPPARRPPLIRPEPARPELWRYYETRIWTLRYSFGFLRSAEHLQDAVADYLASDRNLWSDGSVPR